MISIILTSLFRACRAFSIAACLLFRRQHDTFVETGINSSKYSFKLQIFCGAKLSSLLLFSELTFISLVVFVAFFLKKFVRK